MINFSTINSDPTNCKHLDFEIVNIIEISKIMILVVYSFSQLSQSSFSIELLNNCFDQMSSDFFVHQKYNKYYPGA